MKALSTLMVVCGMHLGPLSLGWSSDVRPDEQVVFFPTAGWRRADGEQWELPIHGWIFEPERNDRVRRAALNRFARLLGLRPQESEHALFHERAARFLVDNERRKRVRIQIADQVVAMLPSDRDGHFSGSVRLEADRVEQTAVGGWISYHAVLPEGDRRLFAGHVRLVPPTGVSVISDIDDTIKVSQVTRKRELLRNTFLRPFRAVDGMPSLYRDWAADGGEFHLVSSSPWQLYEPLSRFTRDFEFPPATFHLRRIRLKNPSTLLALSQPQGLKVEKICSLFRRFPQRQFVLVGDSGERDPEAYGQAARQFPDQLLAIYIRDVTDLAAGESEETGERWDRAFRDVPAAKWRVFREVREIETALPRGDEATVNE